MQEGEGHDAQQPVAETFVHLANAATTSWSHSSSLVLPLDWVNMILMVIVIMVFEKYMVHSIRIMIYTIDSY